MSQPRNSARQPPRQPAPRPWRDSNRSAYSAGPLVVGLLAMVLVALFLVLAVERHLSGAWLVFGAHPEVLEALEQALEDQKRLAELDPSAGAEYRRRFEELETLSQNLRILEHSREDLVRRYRQILFFALVGLVGLMGVVVIVRGRRQAGRLSRLGEALGKLAEGRTDLELGEGRNDLIGRIALMIERTSRRMARDRRRLAALQNLSAWQEAARRHAHEMRTPLTGARLELTRLQGMLSEAPSQQRDELEQRARSAIQELERLGRFTQAFTSFARLPRPELTPHDLGQLLEELTTTFAEAWPNLHLDFAAGERRISARVDRDMLRQVLVNLCDNSSQALGERKGRMTLTLSERDGLVILDVADDGPGVDPAVLPRLFEPYTTTRGIGEGMGLGLAICKKILLDHGGDLDLHRTDAAGATFRLTLPSLDQPIERAE